MCDERGTIGAGDVLSGCQLGIASSEGGEVLRRVGVGKRARSGWEGGCSFKNGQKLHFTGSSAVSEVTCRRISFEIPLSWLLLPGGTCDDHDDDDHIDKPLALYIAPHLNKDIFITQYAV